jgi:site-specific DNA-methyltransferase (adenine-specific)
MDTTLLDQAAANLSPGGLLFVHGQPPDLAPAGAHLSTRLVFKYWIALGPDGRQGLLMFWKPGGPFQLHTDAVRVPHAFCAACGKTLKDWGGKRHLMNPRGAVLSDVWRDITGLPLDRLRALTGHDVKPIAISGRAGCPSPPPSSVAARSESPPNRDQILHTDCISFLDSVPAGSFDLCFADPPYNLAKLYSGYDDAQAEHEYLAWCDRWLAGMARALKPGGSLFVLNLPKWAMHHVVTLNRHLDFHRWLVWDALSDPRGKLMPAHYALLWYTKPGAPPVVNELPPIDAPKYCLRAGCIQKRKAAGDDDKVPVTDIWWDIHRIKHKRDRDAHPCQLPDKLLDRIIRLASRPGDVVFDPFGGTGTTGLVAKRLGRQFVLTELDPEYVRIATDRLTAPDQPRASVARPRKAESKREVELYLQDLARQLGRRPLETEIVPAMLAKIDRLYPYRGAALKRCRVVLTP